MAKFTNNSATATVNRRCAAQGVSLEAVIKAILAFSDEAKASLDTSKLGFSEGNLPSKTLEEMAETISELVGYGGGYMYAGEYASVLQYPEVRFDHICHWSRDYDDRDPSSFVEGNFGRLQRLIEGSTLRIGKDDAQDSSYEDWELKGEGVWVHTLTHCGQTARWEEENLNRSAVYLFSGIRAAVADKLGVEADYGFHKIFDLAVEEIYS